MTTTIDLYPCFFRSLARIDAERVRVVIWPVTLALMRTLHMKTGPRDSLSTLRWVVKVERCPISDCSLFFGTPQGLYIYRRAFFLMVAAVAPPKKVWPRGPPLRGSVSFLTVIF